MAKYQPIPESDDGSGNFQSNGLRRRKQIMMIAIFGIVLTASGIVAVAHNKTTYYKMGQAIEESSRGMKKLKHTASGVPLGCKVNVFIARHCEKSNLRQDCTPFGMEHAEYFASLFGDNDERWPAPSRLYARAEESPKFVKRSHETLIPIAEKFNLEIIDDYGTTNKKEMISEIFEGMQDGSLCGHLVIINWKHENVPKIARGLGCGPLEGCPIELEPWDYDFLWSINYKYDIPTFSSKKSGKVSKNPEWLVQGQALQQDFDMVAWDKKKKQAEGV